MRSPRRTRRFLHLGADEQRGGVPLPVARASLRNEQFSGLLQHVPRIERRGHARVVGHGEGDGHARGLRGGRCHLHFRTESRHKSSAHADRVGESFTTRRAHRQFQPLARSGTAQLHASAARAGHGLWPQHADQLALLPTAGRWRPGGGPCHGQAHPEKAEGDPAVLDGDFWPAIPTGSTTIVAWFRRHRGISCSNNAA